jgi:formate dehydrogenase subunit gamma
MELEEAARAGAGVLYMIATMGHIYMGTIGNEGAYRAMRDGTIDEQWAKEHHELWYDEIKRRSGQDGPPPRRAGASPRAQH